MDGLFITDSQVHIWGANTPQRPWPVGRPSKPQLPYPVSAEALLFQMDLAGVDRVVLVPPSWEGDRNDLVIDAAARYPDRFASMGRIDLNDPNARSQLANWRKQPGMLGIRFLFDGPDAPQQIADCEWLWSACETHGVPVTMQPAGWLKEIGALAERHPGMKIAIDHAALSMANPVDPDEHLIKLGALARHPNIAVKASALTHYSKQPYPFTDVQRWIKRVYDAFGPSRTFWGTDLTKRDCTYKEYVTLFTEHLPWLRGDDLKAVMGTSVCNWFGWPLPKREV